MFTEVTNNSTLNKIKVKLEFQIRTHAMHFWASIEHSLKYKYSKQIPDELKERLYLASLAGAALDGEMSMIHTLIAEYDKKDKQDNKTSDPLEQEVSMNTMKRW